MAELEQSSSARTMSCAEALELAAKLERLGRDFRCSDEFIGIVVRERFPRDYSTLTSNQDSGRDK